jgi:DNA-binding transcriptional ArsR family regulator
MSCLTTFRCLAKYRNVNKVFKALSDPTRRRVLQLLRERPMSAGELSDHFAVSKPTMSAHFAVLQEAGLIQSEKTGRTIVYRLVMSVLEEALFGFAQTFGWGVDSPRGKRAADRVVKRPVKGEA